MQAGLLRERVALESRTLTSDSYGQQTPVWESQGAVYAQAVQIDGRELVAAEQVQQGVTVRFRIRRRDDVAPTWRLTWRGLVHDITAAYRFRRDMTEIVCTQGLRAVE